MTRPPTLRIFGLLVSLLSVIPARAADIPSPPAPDDFRLVSWTEVVDYCRKADETSDRVLVRELGKTTEGRPYLVAFVSNEPTILNLEKYRTLQAKLVDPKVLATPAEGDNAIAESKVVVLITCSIHSTETASTFMALRLLHDLASGDDPATREILDKVILLLVPSANPDGVDKVAAWYERTKGHPWEGSGMPELYHKYAGHDTNRDWFMLNLKETRLLTRLLYREWFPTITYDVHQMGSRGPRLFVPPFHDPINPNLDPRIHQAIAMIGSHMAFELSLRNKRGVVTRAMYDNWWNGGNRTTPQRHNMVGVLTEAASVKLASPIFLDKSELQGGSRGFPDHKPSVDFVDPWPGGWWRLADIAEYERICARSLLTLAARYKNTFQRNYYALGRDAMTQGLREPPFAWIVPGDQRDPGTAARMVGILRDTGIVVHRANEPFQADGVTYPAGSWILPAGQPYRAHLKDMMERQVYPDRLNGRGEPERPYDVAGWTLPLQMGVRAVQVDRPFALPAETLERIEPPKGRIEGSEHPDYYTIANQSNDDFLVLNALLQAGVEVRVLVRPTGVERSSEPPFSRGTWMIRANEAARQVLDEVLPKVSTVVHAHSGEPSEIDGSARQNLFNMKPQRIGVYQPWVPSMDEGWTRFVLESFRFPYHTLHNADIRAGNLRDRLDVLLIPSISSKTLREGYGPEETEPTYAGGLGAEGSDAIRDFVRSGGTLVCLEDACQFAIDELDLPVINVLRNLRPTVFYAPGSIVRLRYPRGAEDLLTLGMPAEGSAYFAESLAFEPKKGALVRVAAEYPSSNVLESGWLLGAEKIQGRAAILEVPEGHGRVILFGIPPQHRGQTHATFRLLFNALLRGGLEPIQ